MSHQPNIHPEQQRGEEGGGGIFLGEEFSEGAREQGICLVVTIPHSILIIHTYSARIKNYPE